MPVTTKQNQPVNKNELYFTVTRKTYTVSYKDREGKQITRDKSVVYLTDGKGAVCGLYGNEKLARQAIPRLRERIQYLTNKYNNNTPGKMIPDYFNNKENKK